MHVSGDHLLIRPRFAITPRLSAGVAFAVAIAAVAIHVADALIRQPTGRGAVALGLVALLAAAFRWPNRTTRVTVATAAGVWALGYGIGVGVMHAITIPRPALSPSA